MTTPADEAVPGRPTPAASADPHAAWVCRAGHTGSGGPGSLAGLRVGVKDIIVTADLPTRFGSRVPAEAFAGLLALGDADCVKRLRAAGAVIAGKTVTAELATYSPGPTVNPLNHGHTPGGSSSGSAAAVCAGEVPLALATQTAGSVIRPASFCGIFGFKPTFGSYSTRGVLATAPSLDTLGLMAATPQLLARGDEVLALNPPSGPAPPTQRLVLYRTARWEEAAAATRSLIEAQYDRWRPLFAVSEVREPVEEIEALRDIQYVVHCGEIAEELGWLVERFPGVLSDAFLRMVQEGRAAAGAELEAARAELRAARGRAAALLPPGEVWVTPAATGPAPPLADGTGNPLFCRVWTALGVPCATLPAGPGAPGVLPTGIQLVAAWGQDRMLLETLALLAGSQDHSSGETRQ